MNLTRCENGHFYDADRFDTCPHCNQAGVSTVMEGPGGEKEYTLPLDENGSVLKPQPPVTPEIEDAGVTIGYFEDVQTEPVVGWLVAIDGEHLGEDFKLTAGRNFIGRDSSMNVALAKDNTVSRSKHAVVLYEPKSNMFIVQAGEAKELCYLNDKVVLAATELAAYDVLTLGKTKLLFIPCCSDKFNWDSVKKEEK